MFAFFKINMFLFGPKKTLSVSGVDDGIIVMSR